MAQTGSDADAGRPVARRLVCYLAGFDPQGPGHYHQLYRDQAARQALVNGTSIEVGPRRRHGEHIAAWEVRWSAEGARPVETHYEFLRWDDIVRQHWPRSRWHLLLNTVWASACMWRNGVMWRTLSRSWPMFAVMAAPGALLGLVALLCCGLVVAGMFLALHGAPMMGSALWLFGVPLSMGLALHAERKQHMAWLMRSLACIVKQGRGQVPELEARLDEFATHLAEALAVGGYDEVLLVGHSSGAMLAMSVAARALRQQARTNAEGQAYSRLSLLTLGHCALLLSAQPEAHAFRQELAELSLARSLCWVDFGAPPDGCCLPMVDPTEGCRRSAQATPARGPKLLNPRFAQMFGPEAYAEIRADKFRCHFQYLMAGERPSGYDYFALTAGPQTLCGRHTSDASAHFLRFQFFGTKEP